jgi:tellurite resistance protein TerC
MVWLWVGFILFILLLLALDLGVFHRHAHVVKVKEALVWSVVWVGLSLLFGVFVYFAYENHWVGLDTFGNHEPGWSAVVVYFSGYILEKSLSVDNVFVIALIFTYFKVPPAYQHRVLYWGILGALVMRGLMIWAGALLIARFQWIFYIFGLFLIYTAVHMMLTREEPDPKKNKLVLLARRLFPITDDFVGEHLVVRVGGKWTLTPLALALVVVESTDLAFALDSIPAIFALTTDPFLVFTSNVFAILGLRSLYFALAGMMDRFHYLKVSLAVLLALIGVKMLLKDFLHDIPGLTVYMLAAIAVILTAGIVASLVRTRRQSAPRQNHGRPNGDAEESEEQVASRNRA